jgi:NhaP-type Na+/H+ and K+/H+ antiporter
VGERVCGSDGAKHAGVESASHEGVTVALRVAFFLGNLPVALSSSIVMLENGMSRMAIFLMWLLLTGN